MDVVAVVNPKWACYLQTANELAEWCLFAQNDNCGPAQVLENARINLVLVASKATDIWIALL